MTQISDYAPHCVPGLVLAILPTNEVQKDEMTYSRYKMGEE